MAKCGKGCMPECQYYTTGGCISPFNCMYKEESGYINSAISGKIFYTGGMNMTNEEMIENLKCVIADISAQCEELKAENAALRERLEKSVELPCKVGDTIFYVQYFCDYKGCDSETQQFCCGCKEMLEREKRKEKYVICEKSFALKDFEKIGKKYFTTRKAAEARLAELQGGKE